MTTTMTTRDSRNERRLGQAWAHLGRESATALAQAALAFVDTASISLGRATAYNDRAAQQAAELAVHDALLRLDRDLYALLLTLPGVTDRARQVGVKNLLGVKNTGQTFLPPDVERRVLAHLVAELPAPRIFKMFAALRVSDEAAGIHRANNARTRKLILRVVLGSPRVELWAVKYRRKMADSLTHAWGVRLASIVRSILEKEESTWTGDERAIVRKAIDRYAPQTNLARVRACVAFVLGARVRRDFGLLSAYEAAKTDLASGAKLPTEVLEGIRSVFHKETKHDEVLRLTASTMTTTQRMTVQRRAAEAGVEVRMDPTEYDPVRLYLYAFEMGMTDAIASALREKAKKAAAGLRLAYRSIGILVDASASMEGSGEQRLRPMATALALRDVLTHAADAAVLTAGGVPDGELLVRPAGATSLADALLELVARGRALHASDGDHAVFVLSDGYENRPAGRFAEVVDALRAIGIATPIYHLNPVFAAESKGVRTLAPESSGIATLPVSGPAALAVGFVRGMLQSDPHRGLEALVAMTLPALTA